MPAPPQGRFFPDTQWSLVFVAARDGDRQAQDAFASLFKSYWYPLFAYARGRCGSPHEAEELLQAFFVHLFEHRTLSRADRVKGSFRGFLIGCLRYFMADQRAHAAARKRGGGVRVVSIDVAAAETRLLEDPASDPATDVERAFDQRWARLLMERALAELESTYAARLDVYRALKGFLTLSDERRYEEVAAALNVSAAMIKTTVHRMRRQLRDILRREVALTVSAPHEIDAELRHLVRVLPAD